MRAPLSWLRDYVDLDLAPDALAEQLTMRGMEVSGIEISGADWTDVVVGRLLDVRRHPNADTLWLTSVDVGRGDPLQIVCGAQNLAVGQLVPTALVGALLPGGRRIERSRIRGVVSDGMLCSAVELGLGADAAGIHILGTGDELPPGTDLRQRFGEVVLDVDVKPNRGDALSMVGLAREIAAFSGAGLRMPPTAVTEGEPSATDLLSVVIEAPDRCPRFTARVLLDVANGPSPAWMQRRLLAAGMRPISAIVDVTNYVMHELGQPQHAYDADAVPGGALVVRLARGGEQLEMIDHQRRALDDRMLVIADATQPVGLAGIMGGAATEVTDATRRVILESAIFHGPTVRNTARRLGLRSEASMRHEKGIGHDLPRLAGDRAARLIAEITGATVASGIVDNDPAPKPRREIRVDLRRTARLLGIEIDADAAGRLLGPLGFDIAPGSDASVQVTVPPFRLDVVEPVDVAEELARAHGYAAIPGRLPVAELPPFRRDPSADRSAVRRILAGLGLDEVVSHALIGPDAIRRSGGKGDAAGTVSLFNPLSIEHSLLRPSLAPSLLAAMDENVRQRRGSTWIFEIGKTYCDVGDGPLPMGAESAGTGRAEVWHVGIALLGPRVERAVGTEPRAADVSDLKGLVEGLHNAIGAPAPAYRTEPETERHAHLHPGRAGWLVDAAGRDYGSLGEVHPDVARAWDLPGRPVLATINLPHLLALRAHGQRTTPVPAAQPVDRDLAVVVPEATPLGDVLRIARTSAGPTLASVRVFDIYRGSQVEAGRVSYALAFRFQPVRSGDEQGVDRALNKVRGSLQHHLAAEIR